MDLRIGSKRIKAIYKGCNVVHGISVNSRLWHGAEGKVCLYNKVGTIVGDDKVYYNTLLTSKYPKIEVLPGGIAKKITQDYYSCSLIVDGGEVASYYVPKDNSDHSSKLPPPDVTVQSGGVIKEITTVGDVEINVKEYGTINNATFSASHRYDGSNPVFEYARLYVSSGGVVDKVLIPGIYGETSQGTVVVSNGGLVKNITCSLNATVSAVGGGLVENAVINSGASMTVYSGGTGHGITINSGCSLCVSSGGTASATTLNRGGSMTVFQKGISNDTIVSSGGSLYISSGGTAFNVTSETGAWIYAQYGGVITYK